MGREKPLYDSIPDHRHRLFDFVSEAFLFCAPGFPAYQFVRGFRGAPCGGRLAAGAQAVRANTPRVVGSFAAFTVMFSAAESAASLARGKEDPWNTIFAGAAATGLKHIRRGAFCAALAGLIGALIAAAAVGVFYTFFAGVDRRTTHGRRTPIKPGPPAAVATAQLHW